MVCPIQEQEKLLSELSCEMYLLVQLNPRGTEPSPSAPCTPGGSVRPGPLGQCGFSDFSLALFSFWVGPYL